MFILQKVGTVPGAIADITVKVAAVMLPEPLQDICKAVVSHRMMQSL